MAPARSRAKRTKNAGSAAEAAELARLCARLADDKKAQDVVVLDLREFTYVTDFFVIATATNPRQMQAIAAAIEETLRLQGARPLGAEGAGGRWLLMDYGDVVVHLFEPDWRRLYDLELLWGDAPRLEWRGDDASGGTRGV